MAPRASLLLSQLPPCLAPRNEWAQGLELALQVLYDVVAGILLGALGPVACLPTTKGAHPVVQRLLLLGTHLLLVVAAFLGGGGIQLFKLREEDRQTGTAHHSRDTPEQ